MKIYRTKKYIIDRNCYCDFDNTYRVVVETLGHKIITECGTQDDIEIFNCKQFIYILTINRGLAYIGLSVYDRKDGCLVEDIFLQGGEIGCENVWLIDSPQSIRKVKFLLNFLN